MSSIPNTLSTAMSPLQNLRVGTKIKNTKRRLTPPYLRTPEPIVDHATIASFEGPREKRAFPD